MADAEARTAVLEEQGAVAAEARGAAEARATASEARAAAEARIAVLKEQARATGAEARAAVEARAASAATEVPLARARAAGPPPSGKAPARNADCCCS